MTDFWAYFLAWLGGFVFGCGVQGLMFDEVLMYRRPTLD